MIRYRVAIPMAGLVAALQLWQAHAATEASEYQEVYDLLREHLTGATAEKLDRAGVNGLVTGFGAEVRLIRRASAETESDADRAEAQTNLLRQASLFDEKTLYLRVGRVASGLSDAVAKGYRAYAATNQLQGLVLDLRYAQGDDYAAAGQTADRFVKKARALLDWGAGSARSSDKTDAISIPVAVLANRQTAGAAEALAAVLRDAGSALILGTTTAGDAVATREFPLKNGDRLRIATAPVKVGESLLLTSAGLKPDITVEVGKAEEKIYYANPYAQLTSTNRSTLAGFVAANTNLSARRPRNEADLVRERREELNGEVTTVARRPDPEKPVVADPVLARALDLIKGLAVVRQTQS